MKIALITGANKGIGFETARQLAQKGYFVYLGSRKAHNGSEAVKTLKQEGISEVDWIEIDVTDLHSIVQARQKLEITVGYLDLLVNNAGIAGAMPQNIASYNMTNLREVFDTNFFGAVQTTQQFIPLLEKSKTPRIINVSSELGSLAIHQQTQNPNYSIYDAYSCSKTALNAFTVLLDNALRHKNFKINSVTPGYTATDLNGFQGAQTVAQGASSIVRYATEDGDGPTGGFFRQETKIPW
jgi:NAD(P)-dependent dehydrogenase (short-subunit alcohol dehydrogenase family)